MANSALPSSLPAAASTPAPSRAPATASEIATPAVTSPAASFGSHSACCAGVPAQPERQRRQHSRAEERGRRDGRAQRLRRDRGFTPQAAMLLGDQQPRQAKLGEPAPEVGRGRLALVGEPAHPLQRRKLLQSLADAGLQQLLVFREREPHQALAALGSRGMPRPRSEMMFFWI